VLQFAAHLAARWKAGELITVTWLNHYSARIALTEAPMALQSMTFVGIDGLFLCMLLNHRVRTSADLVLPLLLPRLHGARLAVIGSHEESLDRALAVLKRQLSPSAAIVAAHNGYIGVPRAKALGKWLERTEADVLLVGMGAGRQEAVAYEASNSLSKGLVLTCGGYLDQVSATGYYPRWAYPLRLNWAVRLWREPRRLWRRYTLDAVHSFAQRDEIVSAITSLSGYWSALEACSPTRLSELDADDRDN
jgi:exopolysaccharide biosynthesis WecB/TagA/CpsF family protein